MPEIRSNLAQADDQPPSSGGTRIIFYVDDVGVMNAHILDRGFTSEAPSRDASWGKRYFHLTDPRPRPFLRPALSGCRRMTLSRLRKTLRRIGLSTPSFLSLFIFGLILAAAGPAVAQNNFEIQVYPSETVAPGTTMVELHSNVAAQGTTKTKDGVLRTQGAFHETLEITQGWTSWFETGFYVFTSIQPDTTWEWVGDHIRPRLRVPESWKLPVGLSLSAEIGYQQRSFSVDTWTLELRPIIDKQWERWYVSINPVLDRAITGDSVKNGFEFSPAAKISYSVTPKVAVGLEYYGALGPVTHFDRGRDQQHQLFPVIDLDLGPKWEFNFGVGFGLTPSTDRLIVKMILGYRFEWGGGAHK